MSILSILCTITLIMSIACVCVSVCLSVCVRVCMCDSVRVCKCVAYNIM